MTPHGRSEKRHLSYFATVIAMVFAAPFVLASAMGIRINISPSLPLGFYRKTADPRARLAEFCPQEPYAQIAIERGYRSRGNCPDGAAPLLKPIVANSGDTVYMSDLGISVNGVLLPNTGPRQRDTRGRSITAWITGRYTVPVGFVWVASSYNRWSYDSRYFGPVPVLQIRGYLRPLLTF